MSKEPRAFTLQESRTLFVQKCRNIAEYWAEEPKQTELDRCMGVVHSIFATIAGCSLDVPGFMLVPFPDPTDQDYHREQGENWFPLSETLEDAQNNDIGNGLNYFLYNELTEVDRGPRWKENRAKMIADCQPGAGVAPPVMSMVRSTMDAKLRMMELLVKGKVDTV